MLRPVALSLAAILSMAQFANAQDNTGTIIGTITDPARRPLVGAEVKVDGANLGARTDQTGRYRIALVPAGSVHLTTRFLGYQSVAVTVSLTAGQTLVKDIQMGQAVQALEAVTIEGQREGQARALTQQQTADNAKNVISADAIGRNPDINSAEAVSRVPGVSITRDQGEGRFVSIRGTPPEFTNISVNGERLPAPDRDLRSVGLDAIMPDVLAAIDVSKTLTPDMDGDAIGGAVNLVTKTAERDHTIANLSYSRGRGDLRGGDINQGSGTFGKRFGADQKFGFLASAALQKTVKGSDDLEATWDQATVNGTPTTVLTSFEPRYYLPTRSRMSFITNTDWRYSDNGSMALKASFNNFYDTEIRWRPWRFRPGTYAGDSVYGARVEDAMRNRDVHQQVGNVALTGNQSFHRATIDWTLNGALAEQRDPHRWEVVFRENNVNYHYDMSDPAAPTFAVSRGSLTDASLFNFTSFTTQKGFTTDRDLTGRLNLTEPFRASGWDGALKIGVAYRNKRKTADWTADSYSGITGTTLHLSDVQRTLVDGDYFEGRYPLDNPVVDGVKLQQYFEANAANVVHDTLTARLTAAPNIYSGHEKVAAAYIMTTLEKGKVKLIPGVRIERTSTDLTGMKLNYTPDGATLLNATLVPSDHAYTDVLPGLNSVIHVDGYTNIRASVYKSLVRPNFGSVRPYEDPDVVRQTVVLGNPDLVSVTAWNWDAGIERYFRSIGVVSINGFYKKLPHFIGDVTFNETTGPYAGYIATQPRLGSEVTVKGFEVNWQQQLAFLPGPLAGLGVNANYTHASTESIVPALTEDDDSNRKAPFIGQVPNSANAALFFERYGVQARLAYNFRDTFLDTYGASAALDFYTKKSNQLDFSGSVKVMQGTSLFIEMLNLTNQPLVRYVGDVNHPIQQEYYHWWGSIGVRYAK